MVRSLISRTTNAVLIDTSSDIMSLNYCLDNEDFSPGEMMLQELEAGRLPTHEGTYVDISWHKMRRRCTWLWGCAPAGKRWGCTQTAEGTGSRTPRCRWNWCTPAEKAHDPGQEWTASRPPHARGGVIFSQHPPPGSFIPVTFWMAQLSLSSLNTKWERNWSTDPEPRRKRGNVVP